MVIVPSKQYFFYIGTTRPINKQTPTVQFSGVFLSYALMWVFLVVRQLFSM